MGRYKQDKSSGPAVQGPRVQKCARANNVVFPRIFLARQGQILSPKNNARALAAFRPAALKAGAVGNGRKNRLARRGIRQVAPLTHCPQTRVKRSASRQSCRSKGLALDGVDRKRQEKQSLMFNSYPLAEQVKDDKDKKQRHAQQYRKTNPQRDVGNAEESVAKGVDHVENRVRKRNILPELGELLYRIKYSAQVGQRSKHKSRHDGYSVESFGKDAVYKPRKRKKYRSKQDNCKQDCNVENSQMRKEERYYKHQSADHKPAHHSPAYKTCDNNPVWSGRHQNFLYIADKLRKIKSRNRIRIGAGDDRHHYKPGHDKLHVRITVDWC